MWLAAQGWRILAERVKTKRGEIDLVARRTGLVAFIEVKWRARSATLSDAIDERRLPLGKLARTIFAQRVSVRRCGFGLCTDH